MLLLQLSPLLLRYFLWNPRLCHLCGGPNQRRMPVCGKAPRLAVAVVACKVEVLKVPLVVAKAAPVAADAAAAAADAVAGMLTAASKGRPPLL